MTTIFLGAGLGLALALLLAIYRRLADLPARVWAIATKERARDELRVVAALQDATAAKVDLSVAALRAYEQHVAERYLQLVAAAETRARVAERRSSETTTALTAASALVRELRAALDVLATRSAAVTPADPDQRETIELPKPPARCATESADSDEPEDEPTKVGTRALVGTRCPEVPTQLVPTRGEAAR